MWSMVGAVNAMIRCLLLQAYCILLYFTDVDFRQDPPPAKRSQLTLLQYLLYYGGLEPNPQHPQGMPVLNLMQFFINFSVKHIAFSKPSPRYTFRVKWLVKRLKNLPNNYKELPNWHKDTSFTQQGSEGKLKLTARKSLGQIGENSEYIIIDLKSSVWGFQRTR